MRFLVLLLFLWSSTAAGLDCTARPDRTLGETWRYRVIDGKACWYRGTEGLPKSSLQWLARVDPDEQARESPTIVQTVVFRKADYEEPKEMAWYAKVIIAFFIGLSLAICAAIVTVSFGRRKK